MTPSITFATEEPLWRRLFPNHEWALAAMLFVETAVFAFIGDNFFTGANGFEIIRLSVEVGLLAMALTPVIITGGIDLSVGSMMGLSAIVCGWLWRDAGLPIWASAALTLALGLLGGGLNALMIARFNLPPLIVTLGTFSLFRGLAEGVTGGVDNYTGFPQHFLFLGQGYLFGILPPQTLALIAVAVFYYLLLHRTIIGRGLYAIGFSAEGARYAGVPVARRVGLVYLLSGLAASLAAVIYIAHLGQAKSDAGAGYELMAITAVVLGGTSIFGGRGTLWGTALGLFAIVILQNGLRLAALPAELAGILTGALLVVTICVDRFMLVVPPSGGKAVRVGIPPEGGTTNVSLEEFEVKNSQVAILSAVILTAGYLLWTLQRMFLGPPNEKYLTLPEINGRELFTLVPLGAIVIFLGVYPTPILKLQNRALIGLNEHVLGAAPRPAQDLVATSGQTAAVARLGVFDADGGAE